MRSPAGSARSGLRSFRDPEGTRRSTATLVAGFVSAQAPPAGPATQDPGWTVAVPGVIFLALAALVWWIWRRLAD